MKYFLPLLSLCLLTNSLRAEAPAKVVSIPEAMQVFVKDGQLSGAVTLLAQKGEIVSFEATGFQDLESKTPMAKDSLFWIASMTKPITAMAVMMLQDEGKLNVDEPVAKYLPEFKNQMLVKEKTD
eukprot:gene18570-22735_t